jgi:hypothetical protein
MKLNLNKRDVGWILLAEGMDLWQALVKATRNLYKRWSNRESVVGIATSYTKYRCTTSAILMPPMLEQTDLGRAVKLKASPP